MTRSDHKRRAARRHRLGAILGAGSLAIALTWFGGAIPALPTTLIQPAFAQFDRDHPPPPDEERRRAEEERLRIERERHDHPYYPPPPAYVTTPPPVYYAPATPTINLDFIFPIH
jgi:hypothetical protein